MSTRSGGPPTLDLGTDGRLCPADRFDELWAANVELSASWRDLDVAGYLQRWCGGGAAHCAGRFVGLHHIGIYLGDYEDERHALAWNDFLAARVADGSAACVEVDPSYIAPKQYGTQGWLSSVTMPDGAVFETFTCKRYGPWAERSVEQRRTLMSHAALEVDDVDDVRYVIDRLAAHADALEVIAFTEADEFGHTYGHLRDNRTSGVIEVVHQGPIGDGAPPS